MRECQLDENDGSVAEWMVLNSECTLFAKVSRMCQDKPANAQGSKDMQSHHSKKKTKKSSRMSCDGETC